MSQSNTWDSGLAERAAKGDPLAIAELAGAVPELSDPSLIHAAARLLESDATLRVADVVANALIRKLGLQPSFPHKAAGYTEAELAEVRRLIRNSLPQ